ncbi:MAG: hypothetical protein U7123_10165 [Potamolinea sp.]
MNLKAIALASILGISTPVIADIALGTQTFAQVSAPVGMYGDGAWMVTINYYQNVLNYEGKNVRTGDTLKLRGARVGGDSERRIYTWSNGDFQYQVAWQPSDPGVIRLQVFDGGGRETLNRLLYVMKGD